MNEVMVNEERGMAVRNSQTEMMVNLTTCYSFANGT